MVTVYRLGFGIATLDKLILPIWGAFKALMLNRRQEYDYFWGIMVTFASLAGYIANGILGIFGKRKRMVLTLQEGDSEEHLNNRWGGLIGFSWRVVLGRTDKLTAISTYLLDRAHRIGYGGEAHLVPNGVDVNKFRSKDKGGDIRKKFNLKEDDIVLITTSRLVEKNAVTDIIDALTLLPENIKFLIIGTGPIESDLKLKTQNLKLDSRVFFVGQIGYENIPKYLHDSDIFIRPSLSEGMGNSFIEAMAAGIPVIATPVGGITDFLFDPDRNPEKESTGLFCEVNNPESIANQVGRYLENPALREGIILNASRMVERKYDWDLISKNMQVLIFNK